MTHSQPVLAIADVAQQGSSTVSGDLQAGFTNCIFWGGNGSVDNEVVVSRQGTHAFNIGFTNCLWKVKAAPTGVTAAGMIANQDPQFDSVNNSRLYYNFHLRAGSPAAGVGAGTALVTDLDGNPRPALSPDLGAYQRQ
jgi:hypothetical protein